MTEPTLEQIEARWSGIIEPEDVDAPWTVQKTRLGDVDLWYEVLDNHFDIRATCQEPEVAAAFAAARTDAQWLIRRVRKLAEERAILERSTRVFAHCNWARWCDDASVMCVICGGRVTTIHEMRTAEQHKPDCAWKQARDWVDAHPARFNSATMRVEDENGNE